MQLILSIKPVDLILLLVLLLIIGGSLVYTIYRKRKGISACGSCSGCQAKPYCHEISRRSKKI